MSLSAKTDSRYWSEYDGLQNAKHQLLVRYLGGWFPILSSWNGQVLYLDCHAGRGRHETGQEGSPILALRTLLEHQSRDKILDSTSVQFVFFEIRESNYGHLCEEIKSLGSLPRNMEINPVLGDYEEELREIINTLRMREEELAPAFAFLDPYGFSLPMDLCNELLQFPRCEIFVNFMYRYIDMAIHNTDQDKNLDLLFGCSDWRRLAAIDDYEKRLEETVTLLSEQLEARFVTHMYMRARNGMVKYILFHATNNPRGREVMKEAIWSVTPDGSFEAFEHHHPDQLVLIRPEPDLKALEEMLWKKFAGQEVNVEEMYDWLLGTLYRKPHLHKVLRQHRQRKLIKCSGYSGNFAFSKNPRIYFPSQKPLDGSTMALF